MNIYAWLYNKRCNLFLKKKTRSMPAVSQLLSFSLKDESHIKHELLWTAQHKSYRKWASTSPFYYYFQRLQVDFWVSLEKTTGFGPCGFRRTAGHFAKSAARERYQPSGLLPLSTTKYRKRNTDVRAAMTLKEKRGG